MAETLDYMFSFNWTNIIYNIIFTFLNAAFFWYVFSYRPLVSRSNKIRPKINQDLEFITTHLTDIFYIVFENKFNRASSFRIKIVAGNLKMEDIEFGLQNKCFDVDEIKDFPFKYLLISIGKRFERNKNLIINRINELYLFSEFLDTFEIITLEKIKKILNSMRVGIFRDSNLSILSAEFYDLYKQLSILNEINFGKNSQYIETNEFFDITFPLYQISYYIFNKKDFKRCRKFCKKYIKNFPTTDIFRIDLIRCEYELNNKNKAFSLFKEFINNKDSIEPYTNSVDIFSKYDDRILHYLKATLKESDYIKLNELRIKRQEQEIQEDNAFFETNNNLKKYFKR